MAGARWWLCVLAVLGSDALRLPGGNAPSRPRTRLLAGDGEDIDSVLSGLQSRVQEMLTRRTQLPIVVLDSMLPGQRLKLQTRDAAFKNMLEWCAVRAAEDSGDEQFDDRALGVFGMVGVDRASGSAAPFGVEARVLSCEDGDDGTLRVEIAGGRRFAVDADAPDEGDSAASGAIYPKAVTLAAAYDAAEEAAAAPAAAAIPDLVARWEALVVDGKRERVPDHLAGVRGDLGPQPPPSAPSDLAYWVGGYINPLPALGVSLEIRPQLLAAADAGARVEIAVMGLETSIAHLDGTAPMW